MTTPEMAYQRGRVDALLEEHTNRLNKINGSIERHAEASEDLAKSIISLTFRLEEALHTLQEETHLAAARAEASNEALTADAERRRMKADDYMQRNESTFSKRERLAALTLSLCALVATVFISIHH